MLKHTRLAVFFLFLACGPTGPSEEFKKAAEMYVQTVELEIETRSILGSLEQVVARDTARVSFAPRLQVLSNRLDEWEGRVVSTGGDLSAELGHQHQAGEATDDAEMLRLQIRLNSELNEIAEGLLELMDEMSR